MRKLGQGNGREAVTGEADGGRRRSMVVVNLEERFGVSHSTVKI